LARLKLQDVEVKKGILPDSFFQHMPIIGDISGPAGTTNGSGLSFGTSWETLAAMLGFANVHAAAAWMLSTNGKFVCRNREFYHGSVPLTYRMGPW
jgi:hypothetical protein